MALICHDIDFFGVFFILCNIVNLAFVLLSSNVCHFRFSSMSLTDDLLWYLFVTNLLLFSAHFYFILVLLQIWIPDWASILHRWSYKGDVSPFFKDLCKPVSVLYWKLTQSLSKSYPGVAGVCLHTTCRFLLHVVALNCSFEAFYSFAAHSTFC